MSDIIDRASEREAEFLADALARHQRPSENRGSLKNCADCGRYPKRGAKPFQAARAALSVRNISSTDGRKHGQQNLYQH